MFEAVIVFFATALQFAHKHDIGTGPLKIVLMGFYCAYVTRILRPNLTHDTDQSAIFH
jgi:hypothetical protein